jgi:DNA mismatch repair ATPase MutS
MDYKQKVIRVPDGVWKLGGLLPTYLTRYLKVKQRYEDTILFYRIHSFYELFFDDAEIGAHVLGLPLTSPKKGVAPMCGIPVGAASGYLGKMIDAGYRVAICYPDKNEVFRVVAG